MVSIRPFEPTDRDDVVTLWIECGLTRPWNDPDKDIERKLADSAEWFFVAIEEERLIASMMVGYDGHRGWVNYLAVATSHRERGLGRHLMTYAEQLLTDVGCPKLNLQVRTSNRDVLTFYESLNYQIDDCVSLGKRLIAD